MASSRSEENVVLYYLSDRWCIGKCIPQKFILGESELVLYQNYGRCLSHIMLLLFDNLTDVIDKVADVIATFLADVIAIVM